ncbi:MAG: hypothetical protein HKN87_01060 [Saprospiraceae bacterium]|nr:hypothetical protein [Saprospiraceae bacterium]
MAFEEVKQDLMKAEADARSYLENSEEYLQLKVLNILMTYVTNFAQILLVGSSIVLALFILSIGASLAINQEMDSHYLGFIIVGGIHTLTAVLCYFFGERLNGTVIRTFSKNYFDQTTAKQYNSFSEMDKRLQILKLQREINSESIKLHLNMAKNNLYPTELLVGAKGMVQKMLLIFAIKRLSNISGLLGSFGRKNQVKFLE